MAQAITFTQAEDLVRRKTDPNVAEILRDAPQAIFSHTVIKVKTVYVSITMFGLHRAQERTQKTSPYSL